MYNTNLASFYNASTLFNSCQTQGIHMLTLRSTAVKRIDLRYEKDKAPL